MGKRGRAPWVCSTSSAQCSWSLTPSTESPITFTLRFSNLVAQPVVEVDCALRRVGREIRRDKLQCHG